ncbi:MAG: VWA domain-containing protein [Sulfolobales archaeon]|nr:VWA domain-containing protein [Sulfolobales archaeon]MCX8208131.1 VWA domain-containing protein [Sulfolobales archaeon]MDW8010542.1 VWA domain-containing protein [Sulfolobales archaeon]
MPSVLRGVDHKDPVAIYRGEKVLQIAKKIFGKIRNVDQAFAIDSYYTLYLPYPLLKDINDVPKELAKNYVFFKTLLESEDFARIRYSTIGDSSLSVLVASLITTELEKSIEQLQQLAGSGSERRDLSEEEVKDIAESISRKISETADTVKSIKKLMNFGSEPGTGSVFDLEEEGEEVIKLAQLADIRAILEILSKIPDVSGKLLRPYERYSKGEIRGFEIGGDLERVHPSEIAMPKMLFRLKLAEDKLLLYDKVLPKTLGPIYVLVDKSGSMEGEKIVWAKATLLALLMKSRKDGREFYLRFFNGMPHQLNKIGKRMRSSEFIELMKYLARVKSGGGTDITKAIISACDDISSGATREVSDIVLITDGEDKIASSALSKRLKDVNCRLHTVMIMGDNKDLRKISYRYLRAGRLSYKEIIQVTDFS